MKIFIAGARSVKTLSPTVIKKMHSIFNNGFDVIVGDCYGVDKSVQTYFASLGYTKVSVYASNGIARNNVGNWTVKSISAPQTYKGFDFYRQKDLAMADDADFGLMIWDGKSRGTYSNIMTLIEKGKSVLVYLTPIDKMFCIKSEDNLKKLNLICQRINNTAQVRKNMFDYEALQ